MAGHKTWAVSESMLQSEFQGYVGDQVVAQFASTAARDAGWASPPNGAKCVTTDTGTTWDRAGGVWQPQNTVERAIGTHTVGSAVSASSRLVTKAGSVIVTTTSGGAASFTLPGTAYATGIATILLSVGDTTGGAYTVVPVLASTTLTSIATFHPGAVSVTVRVNYLTIGA